MRRDQTDMTTQNTHTPVSIDFHFDPLCPLAWRTALWIREARKVRPVDIHWRFFSLEIINRKAGSEPDYVDGYGWAGLRTLALARRQQGNDAVEQLYLALGNAQHGHGASIREPAGVRAAVREAGLDAALVNAALDDESTARDVQTDHEEAVQRYRAFGVPTIAIVGSEVGFYGPIIHSVPRGETAGEMWDHLEWALHQPNLFELKRDRGGVQWGPVAE